jgi:hypothetical protein
MAILGRGKRSSVSAHLLEYGHKLPHDTGKGEEAWGKKQASSIIVSHWGLVAE